MGLYNHRARAFLLIIISAALLWSLGFAVAMVQFGS